MLGLTDVDRLLVSVTVCAALEVPTICAANVSDAGVNESGSAALPLTSRICAEAALSVTAMAPLTVPLVPAAGENLTLIVQLALETRLRPLTHGVAPLPVTENSPLAASELSITALALVFCSVTVFPPLVVPSA